MKEILKVFGIIALGIIILAILVSPDNDNPSNDFIAEVIKDDRKIAPLKRSVDIRLKQKITEDELLKVAHQIIKMDSRENERTFILYYLPGMKLDAGAWAKSHFKRNKLVDFGIMDFVLESNPPK